MESGKRKVESGKRKVESGKRKVESGKWKVGAMRYDATVGCRGRGQETGGLGG